ncbi:hypothetical protein GKE82_24095 [Conexibacter sp. W3-3-2]|uniref:hypothetical protein n=1 Tax=Conexibacter sp. W3-3-2 TaxID=2675227 RepID=UPI0012B8E0B1|nr:hypothetical protein [Conexibacter sp. W3-3-2]MTD47290.1 hypothetical protein [Conexibacter sp. W3-3-2]
MHPHPHHPRPGVLLIAAAIAAPLLAGAPPAAAATCPQFIIGQANSSAYPDFQLPARGSTKNASCATLQNIARRLHDGTYQVPDAAAGRGTYGRAFTVRHAGKAWRCRLRSDGGSGPTYAMRCSRPSGAQLRWTTG